MASPGPAEAFSTRACSGSFSQNVPGAVLRADRLRAAGETSCTFARTLVRRFLRAQKSVKCAGAATQPGYVCVVLGYECEKRGARASCLDQGSGVTFRERDASTY